MNSCSMMTLPMNFSSIEMDFEFDPIQLNYFGYGTYLFIKRFYLLQWSDFDFGWLLFTTITLFWQFFLF